MELAERRVVVTGAGRGIGRAVAARLSEAGARVVLNDSDAEAAQDAASAVGAFAVPGDAAGESGVAELVARAREHLGGVDVYVSNAGVGSAAGLDAAESQWSGAFDVNVMAHVRAARLLVPEWLAGSGGRLVVTASAAGLLTMVGDAPYSVSKHAAVAFAEWLSVTYGHRGIVVQALCPQGVRTRMLDESGPLAEFVAHDSALSPDEVADSVLQALDDERFLILPHASVRDYYRMRAGDTDAWLAGMRKLQRKLDRATGAG